MSQTIRCKACGELIEVSEALAHEVKESVTASVKKEYEQKITQAEALGRETASKKAEAEYAKQLAQLAKDKAEQEAQNKKLTSDFTALIDEMRALKKRDEERELEMKKKLLAEEEKIRSDAAKGAKEAAELEMADLKKQLEDTKKSLTDANYKLTQKSQQLQGEVLELDLEKTLADAFPMDDIVPVGKGVLGADITHTVKGKSGKVAGIILWETKRAKWSASWLPKLREDGRRAGAAVTVLVSEQLPVGIDSFQIMDGVIVTHRSYATALASVLRRSLLQIAVAKETGTHKDEKMEILYQYLTSDDFRHRFESFAEGIHEMRLDLVAERRAMERIWKKREAQIMRVETNASRMYGELQGVIGTALPDIHSFALPEAEEE